ncbi:MAG: hypothetical protein ACR2QK_10775 [Acidimicrobiales bacterium]
MTARWPSAVFVATVIAATLSIVAAACGLPVNDEVDILAQDDHLELLQGTTSTTAPVAEPGEPGSVAVQLFFVGQDNKLESVIRELPDDAQRNDVLRALENGPTQDEIDLYEGPDPLQTFVPAGLSAQFGNLDEDRGAQRIIVDPAAELRQRLDESPDPNRLIVSQIVCTVLKLGLAGVSGVEIYDGDEPIDLSNNAAQLIIGPAQLEDFDNCMTGAEERDKLAEAEAEAEGSTTTTT